MPFAALRCRRFWTPLFVAALTAVARAQPAATQPSVLATSPDYSAFTQSVHIPFRQATRFDDLRRMDVRVSINGGRPMLFQVDTGSVGMVVGESALRPGDVPADAPEDSITYSSSGVVLEGVRTPLTLTFVDAKDENGRPIEVKATVPVLVAKVRRRIPGAVNASTNPAATQPDLRPRPFMLGVGFGRGANPRQDLNPFVNLDAMAAGTMRRGYTITRQGFTLGLTKKAVGDGYLFQQLTPRTPSRQMAERRPGLKDWESAPSWVTVDGKDDPWGTVLFDTGLTNMMIGRPDTEQADVPPGTAITVNLMDGRLKYTFNTGDETNPTTPRRVTRTNRPFVYVNTGLRALAVFDYLYDADAGYLGLRPTKPMTTLPAAVKN